MQTNSTIDKKKRKELFTRAAVSHQNTTCIWIQKLQFARSEGNCFYVDSSKVTKRLNGMDDVMHGVLGAVCWMSALIVVTSCCLYWSLACLMNASTHTPCIHTYALHTYSGNESSWIGLCCAFQCVHLLCCAVFCWIYFAIKLDCVRLYLCAWYTSLADSNVYQFECYVFA